MRKISLALLLFAAVITAASARQNNNPAAARTRYTLSLSLKLRGNVLNGAMTAQSLPGRRVGNALTHWVELKKE